MSSSDDLPTLTELREHLREAARREMASAPRRSSVSRWRRATIIAVAALLLAAGAAGAAALLSTGEPVPDPRGKAARYLPAAVGDHRIAVIAADPAAGTKWGVATYTGRNGQQCAIAGQVRAGALGVVRNGTFHPYEPGTSGPCGDLSRQRYFGDQRFYPGEQPRTLIYGRTQSDVSSMTLELDGERYSARLGHGGAFLFLFEGRISPAAVHLSAR